MFLISFRLNQMLKYYKLFIFNKEVMQIRI